MLVEEFLRGWISPAFVSVVANVSASIDFCIVVFLYIYGDKAQRCSSPNTKLIHFGFTWTRGHEGYWDLHLRSVTPYYKFWIGYKKVVVVVMATDLLYMVNIVNIVI